VLDDWPSTEAAEEDPELLDLAVAAGQRWRAGARAGALWVVDRVDSLTIRSYRRFIEIA
jgi:hypothetical protein